MISRRSENIKGTLNLSDISYNKINNTFCKRSELEKIELIEDGMKWKVYKKRVQRK